MVEWRRCRCSYMMLWRAVKKCVLLTSFPFSWGRRLSERKEGGFIGFSLFQVIGFLPFLSFLLFSFFSYLFYVLFRWCSMNHGALRGDEICSIKPKPTQIICCYAQSFVSYIKTLVTIHAI